MNNGNWVKLNRSILKWEWYDDINTFRLFIHALLKANYEKGAYRGHELEPGDVVFGRKKWAKELGLSERQVRTALKHLQKTGEISTIKTTNKFTILRIEKWALHQVENDKSDQQNNQQATNKRPTSDQQATTYQERKERKEGKKEKNNISPLTPLIETLPPDLQESVWEFVEHRKQIKAPMTELAVKKMLNKLNELSGGDTRKCIAILNQSIINGWKGIFQLDEKKTKTGNKFLDLLAKEQNNDESRNN